MKERIDRIKAFEEFRDNAVSIFDAHCANSKKHKRLVSLYGFTTCPKGRWGGLNEKLIDVFYGNRPIDSITTINENFQQGIKLETAHGAALAYHRKDDGHVICNIYPASSENQRQTEKLIVLDYIKHPETLIKRSKRHWRILLAYMETTCIDGSPNIWDRILVFHLKTFKRMLIGAILKETRATSVSKEIFKYTVTVGFSGFLILVFTYFKDNISVKQEEARLQAITQSVNSKIEELSTEVKQCRKSINLTEDKLSEYDASLSEILMSLRSLSETASKTETHSYQILRAIRVLSLSELFGTNTIHLITTVSQGTNSTSTLEITAKVR